MKKPKTLEIKKYQEQTVAPAKARSLKLGIDVHADCGARDRQIVVSLKQQ